MGVKKFAPFISMSFASFVNSKCFYKGFGKVIVQGLNQSLNYVHHLQM
jgi:hypothetical protein